MMATWRVFSNFDIDDSTEEGTCCHIYEFCQDIIIYEHFHTVPPSMSQLKSSTDGGHRHQTCECRALFTVFNEKPFRTNNIQMTSKI